MLQINLFYFFKLTFLLFLLRKQFYYCYYINNKLNFFFYLYNLYNSIREFYISNYKFFLNYRFMHRLNNTTKYKRSRLKYKYINKYYFFKSKIKQSSIIPIKKSFIFFYNFFFYKFNYYSFFIKELFSYVNFCMFGLRDYFFSKRSKRYTYFSYICLFANEFVSHCSRKVCFGFRLQSKKKKCFEKKNRLRFKYLFGLNNNVINYFNLTDSNFFFVPKRLRIFHFGKKRKKCKKCKKKKLLEFYSRSYRRKKKSHFSIFTNMLKNSKVRLNRSNYFKNYFVINGGKVYLKNYYLQRVRCTTSLKRKITYRMNKDAYFNYVRFRVTRRNHFFFLLNKYVQRYKCLNLSKATKLFLLKSRRFFLKKKIRLIFLPNFFFLKKVLMLLSNLANSRVFYSLSLRFPFFYSYRIIYLILYNSSFSFNFFYLPRFYRSKLIFRYLGARFLSNKTNSQSSLLRAVYSSNATYAYFLPNVCRIQLRFYVTSFKQACLSCIFNNQMSCLFANLFNSNVFFSLNFTDSERLSKGFIRVAFRYFLSFNPPRGNMNYIKELANMYLLTGATKDSNLLLNCIIRNLSITYFRRHWRFLIFLKSTLIFMFQKLQYEFKIKGILISFRGKIGQVGSVRKKALVLRQGITSFVDVGLRLDFSSSVVCTNTGVIGLSVGIYY